MDFPKDPRPASALARFHRRARRRNPALQPLLYSLLAPLLFLLSRIRVSRLGELPAGGYIVACNHPSMLDAAFLSLAIRRRLRFMAKSEFFHGWKGWLLTRLGVFPIRRGVWDTESFLTALSVLERGKVVALFPEGGLSPPGGYRKAKSGLGHLALLSGALVVPVHLQGPERVKRIRPWRWPKVRVRVGEPLYLGRELAPSREQAQSASERVMRAITALDPTL